MKRIHLISIVLIVAAIALLISASDGMGTYVGFEDAIKLEKDVKVACQLIKDKKMYYDPQKDPNYFSFYATDSDGQEQKVVLLKEKPQDFELSEQIVLTGSMEDNVFVATDILLKCPSKYKDEELFLQKEG